MKRTLMVLFALFLMSVDSKIFAQEREFGLGVVFGEPTGITGKLWTGPQAAVDMGLSYSFHDYFLVFADRLWHFPDLFHGTDDFVRHLSPYLGVGGGLFAGKNTRFSVRIPVGVEWLPGKPTVGVFAEIVPAVRLAPEVAGEVGGGIGIRYYF